jgi:hypothetical protein
MLSYDELWGKSVKINKHRAYVYLKHKSNLIYYFPSTYLLIKLQCMRYRKLHCISRTLIYLVWLSLCSFWLRTMIGCFPFHCCIPKVNSI